MRSERGKIGMQAGELAREGQYDVNRLNQQRNEFLAGLTAPRQLEQTSQGSSRGQITQNQSPFGIASAIGGQLGPLSL